MARFGPLKVPNTKWRHRGWRHCGDVDGAPRYMRCMRCERLVTRGQVSRGGCVCGTRKLCGCAELTWGEILKLKLGWFPLSAQERHDIRPLR